ncbi:MAG: hypothetical protein K6G68_11510, partial [Oscillospiraceae bacterium]|nr:hypothetical protein [Oscillospiraceae bacterium]
YESRSEGSRFQLSLIKHILIPLALISVVLWYVHHVKEAIDSNQRAHLPRETQPESPYTDSVTVHNNEISETASVKQTEQEEMTEPYIRPDLHNYADMDEYYKDGIPTDEQGMYIFSHNVFKPRNGEEWTIDLSTETYDENVFSGAGFAGIRYNGDDEFAYSGYVGEWGLLGVTYKDGKPSDCDFATIKEPFMLEADDYDKDGLPDCCVLVSDSVKDIAYYTLMQKDHHLFQGFKGFYDLYSLSDGVYDLSEKSADSSTSKPGSYKYDNTFCVWGRGEPSITFDRIDDDHFFFITINEKQQPETVIYDSEYYYVSPEEIGLDHHIYSASYKDGNIHVKKTMIYYPEESKLHSESYENGYNCKVRLDYLDGDTLKNVDNINMSDQIRFTEDNIMVSSVYIPVPQLRSGRYCLHIYTEGTDETDQTVWFVV